MLRKKDERVGKFLIDIRDGRADCGIMHNLQKSFLFCIFPHSGNTLNDKSQEQKAINCVYFFRSGESLKARSSVAV